MFFCSKGHIGYGGFDIFVSEIIGGDQWGTPENLGHPINSPVDDVSFFLSDDEVHGLFTTARNNGDDDIFLFQIVDPNISEKQIDHTLAVSENVKKVKVKQPSLNSKQQEALRQMSPFFLSVLKQHSLMPSKTQSEETIINKE